MAGTPPAYRPSARKREKNSARMAVSGDPSVVQRLHPDHVTGVRRRDHPLTTHVDTDVMHVAVHQDEVAGTQLRAGDVLGLAVLQPRTVVERHPTGIAPDVHGEAGAVEGVGT